MYMVIIDGFSRTAMSETFKSREGAVRAAEQHTLKHRTVCHIVEVLCSSRPHPTTVELVNIRE